jgi:germination protein M
MNRRAIIIGLVAVGAALLLGWLLSGGGRSLTGRSDVIPADALPTPTPAPEQNIVLLFVGSDGRLHPEIRSVPLPEEVDERVRVVLGELLLGSAGKLHPVVPYPAEVNAVFIDENGQAFVDLTTPPDPLEGSHTELMLVYGVVDSVLLNCPELRAVQVLFGGNEIPTLTGHLDLSRPLVLNKRFIAAS